jgi:hypothetical protein
MVMSSYADGSWSLAIVDGQGSMVAERHCILLKVQLFERCPSEMEVVYA